MLYRVVRSPLIQTLMGCELWVRLSQETPLRLLSAAWTQTSDDKTSQSRRIGYISLGKPIMRQGLGEEEALPVVSLSIQMGRKLPYRTGPDAVSGVTGVSSINRCHLLRYAPGPYGVFSALVMTAAILAADAARRFSRYCSCWANS